MDDDVDDQLYFREAIAEVNPSIECRFANNGLEALEHIEVPPPFDLIFLDLNMPVMNGYECLTTLKQKDQYKNIPVVIFTTSKNKSDIERSKQLGAHLYVSKPTNFTILCSKLSRIFNDDISGFMI